MREDVYSTTGQQQQLPLLHSGVRHKALVIVFVKQRINIIITTVEQKHKRRPPHVKTKLGVYF